MYSLSHAVEVPQTDIDAGNIAITRDASVAPILTLPVGGCRHRAANAPESRAACKLANLTAAGKRATVDTLRTLSATEEALRLR